MKIILSPAKKMNIDTDTLAYQELPVYLEQTKEILTWLKEKTYEEKQIIMGTWGIPFEDILEYDEHTRPKFGDDDFDCETHGLPF